MDGGSFPVGRSWATGAFRRLVTRRHRLGFFHPAGYYWLALHLLGLFPFTWLSCQVPAKYGGLGLQAAAADGRSLGDWAVPTGALCPTHELRGFVTPSFSSFHFNFGFELEGRGERGDRGEAKWFASASR